MTFAPRNQSQKAWGAADADPLAASTMAGQKRYARHGTMQHEPSGSEVLTTPLQVEKVEITGLCILKKKDNIMSAQGIAV